MKLPIIAIDESNDVIYFESTSEVRNYIEPYDIDSWRVFTADGDVLKLQLAGKSESFWRPNPGTVTLVPSSESNVDGLRLALIKHFDVLSEVGKLRVDTKLNQDASLDSLVALLKICQPAK